MYQPMLCLRYGKIVHADLLTTGQQFSSTLSQALFWIVSFKQPLIPGFARSVV